VDDLSRHFTVVVDKFSSSNLEARTLDKQNQEFDISGAI
jgi:hypothetical protein